MSIMRINSITYNHFNFNNSKHSSIKKTPLNEQGSNFQLGNFKTGNALKSVVLFKGNFETDKALTPERIQKLENF